MGDFPGEAQVWAEHHKLFSHQLSHFFHRVMIAFGALHRAQYAAPWRRMPTRYAR